MDQINNYTSFQEILFSCVETKLSIKENLVPEHALTHILSGKLLMNKFDTEYVFQSGETVLFKRNQLAKFTKMPEDENPFRSITIFFTQRFLQKYYTTHHPDKKNQRVKEIKEIKTMRFDANPLLESLFNSLIPYYKLSTDLPPELIQMKQVEAMTILRTMDKGIDHILAEFAEPGKIDLADFMQKNYVFNLSMERFSYLTGRSLATFKRDFEKTFNTTPQKWLLQRRLEQAHFLISANQKKPTEVYLEVGFENLSHFSTAFKQMFGYNASSI